MILERYSHSMARLGHAADIVVANLGQKIPVPAPILDLGQVPPGVLPRAPSSLQHLIHVNLAGGLPPTLLPAPSLRPTEMSTPPSPPLPQLQTSDDVAFPHWSETLRDHTHVVIRPIGKHDGEAERAFIEGLSAESRHFRFLGQVRTPSDRMIEDFTDIDLAHEAAFVAVIPEGSRERIIGVSRYATDSDGRNCECAVTVSDEWQGKGLGTVLMKHLIEVAKARGIHAMTSTDFAENMAMNELARHLGFRTRMDPDDAAQVIHHLGL